MEHAHDPSINSMLTVKPAIAHRLCAVIYTNNLTFKRGVKFCVVQRIGGYSLTIVTYKRPKHAAAVVCVCFRILGSARSLARLCRSMPSRRALIVRRWAL